MVEEITYRFFKLNKFQKELTSIVSVNVEINSFLIFIGLIEIMKEKYIVIQFQQSYTKAIKILKSLNLMGIYK